MFYTYRTIRALALMSLVSLVSQILFPLVSITYAADTSYYVDATLGNDLNDGLTTLTPWKTLARVNVGGYTSGDNILLKCGESWSEELILQDSGIVDSPIVYGSYGICDGSNDPLLLGSGGYILSDNGAPSFVVLRDLNFSGATSILDDVGTDIIIESSRFSAVGFQCISQSNGSTLTLSGNIFDSCQILLGSGSTVSSTNIINNAFTSGVDVIPIFSVSYDEGSSLYVDQNTFTNMSGGAIIFSTNSTIIGNTFTNMCSNGTACSVIQNIGASVGFSTISQNTFSNIGTGILVGASADAIHIEDNSSFISITDNTLSNAQRGVFLSGASNVDISNNTFFNPRTMAIEIEEAIADTTYANIISSNIILTYNPDYPMVKIADMVDASGTLATFSSNQFLNVYKARKPIIDFLTTGGDSYSLDKDNLNTLDPFATNFTHFGYKNYSSTGSYSGSNLITNSTFASDITNWTGDNMTLTHDAVGSTLHASQGVTQTGVISSNSFSLVAGAVYEISGTLKNLTRTGGSYVSLHLRQDTSPQTLYADRVIDVVSTASGKTFSSYITANADVSDARLDLEFSHPGEDIELDTVVVRRVTGLTRTSRTNEARLIVNTGSVSADFSCPGGGGCPLQYRTIEDLEVTFPTTIPAFGSQIILWRDPSSDFTPANILHRPTGSLVPSAGSVPNNDPIDLTWTATNSVTNMIEGTTLTGAFNFDVASAGTLTLSPPIDSTTTFTLNLINDIGSTFYDVQVVTTNTPPVPDNGSTFGIEESLSITGALTATDINSGGLLTFSLFDPPLLSQGTLVDSDGDGLLVNSSGTYDFVPAPNFCGLASFSFRAFDAYGLGSDAINPGIVSINVECTNDDPVAIDDTLTATGDMANLLDVLANDTDPIDTQYDPTPPVFSLIGAIGDINTHGTVTISGAFVEYVSDVGYHGPASFVYTMQDQSGGISSTTGTVTLDVVPGMNLPPMGESGSISVMEDDSFIGVLTGSDYNPGDILTFSTGSSPLHGVVVLLGSGFTYTPEANYNGTDSFTYVVSDGALSSGIATIDITVNGTQDLPVVTNDTIGIEMSANQTLDVMVNDIDVDSPYSPQNLTITGYTLPSHGTLSVVGTGFLYTSEAPYLGVDSFDYSLSDIDGNISNTGTVTLNITSTNTPPMAYSGAFTSNEDITFVGILSGSDVDGTPLTYLTESDVSNGSLNISSTGVFTYIPTADYNGPDSFSFRVSDGVFTSLVAETVTLTVDPVNDAPTVLSDSATGTEDTMLIISGLLDNDNDRDTGDTITLSSIVTQGSKGTAVLSGSTEVRYIPIADMCGTDIFTYQAVDQSGAISGTGNVTVDLICTNDAPTSTDSSFSMTGNVLVNSGITLTGFLTASDIDLDVLDFTLGSGTINGILTFNTGGSFIYSPNIDFTGSDSFTFSATDGVITTATSTVLITVNTNTFNTAPIAYSGAFTTNEDTVLVGTLTGFDLESASLIFMLGTGTTNGIFSLSSTGGFTYTPTANYHGADSYTFRVFDGTLISAYVTGSISVTSINDLPVAVTESTSGTEDTIVVIPVLANDTDIDGTVVSITGLTQPVTGGTLSISGTGVRLTPTANYCSASPISYSYQTVDNNGGTSALTTSSFTLACVSDAPVATDDAQITTEDTPTTVLVLSNDSDLDAGDSLSIASITQSSTGGTASISGLGILYTPTANYCSASPITLTYRARDTSGNLSNTGTVSITINCVNDLPIIQNVNHTMTGNILSGSTNSITGILVGSDVDSSSIIFSIVSPMSSGSLNVSSTGAYSYTPSIGFVGTALATYTADDGLGFSNASTITICVVSPDPSVALPTCAGGQSPIAEVGPIVGPGGGGGGSSSSAGAGSTAIFDYTRFTGGDNVSPKLLSQLLFDRQGLTGLTKKSYSTRGPNTKYKYNDEGVITEIYTDDYSTSDTVTDSQSMTNVPYATLLDIISTVVEFSRDLELSSGENVLDIRRSGQGILENIKTDDSMTDSEKADALRAAAALLTEHLNPTPFEKEYKALQYVIRILKAKETLIRETLDTFAEFLDSTSEEDEYNFFLDSAPVETTIEAPTQTGDTLVPDEGDGIDWENFF